MYLNEDKAFAKEIDRNFTPLRPWSRPHRDKEDRFHTFSFL
jgi:hypothetical protein